MRIHQALLCVIALSAVGGWDAITFGQHLRDDHYGLALAYAVDPSSAYYAAG